MAEFQVHAAADKTYLQHRSAPGRTFDPHQQRLGTKSGMAPNPGLPLPAMHYGVAAMLSLYLQGGPRRKIVEKCSAFNLRRDDVAIHLVVEIGVTAKQRRTGVHPGPLRSEDNDTLSINLAVQCPRITAGYWPTPHRSSASNPYCGGREVASYPDLSLK